MSGSGKINGALWPALPSGIVDSAGAQAGFGAEVFRACSTGAPREVAWLDAGGHARESVLRLSGAWRLRRLSFPLARAWPDLDGVRVGLLDLDHPLPSQLIDFVNAHQQVKWIALVHPGLLPSPALRDLIRDNCYDFHTLPLDQARLEVTLGRACGMAVLETPSEPTAMVPSPAEGRPIIGHSAPMQSLARQLTRVAGSEAPVLFLGESGTGKELAARTVHRLSRRADGPFVAVNCGALPAPLIQSELFGHEAGAFTGATRRKIGQLELAHDGTLLLDEIGDLGLELQVNLLRFLQEGTLVRVGGLQPIQVDVRVLAATHMNLFRAVEAGRFREDLYYRLNVIQLDVPPLRDRGSDLMALAQFYFERFRCQNPRLRGFTQAAVRALHGHRWPGNVRELVNRIQRAVTMAEGRLIRPEDLGFPAQERDDSQETLAQARDRAERETVIRALGQCDNNVSRAARQLGVGRVTLYRLLDKYGVRPQKH
ncbi:MULTISPECIES: sigma-54 dependent transcriptional regulator [unclassified Thioalkalivibrio]|uniref:sigma-54 dependent transcriptional regulator n=1 Tax=unclassified Thioalkalivibrio TaxID=2621013 RepID=UPI0003A238D2